jgi:glutathione S-transferase
MASEITFYTAPMSRGRVVRWLLEELGEPYDAVLLDLRNLPAEFRRLNPIGKVPVIVHRGRVVSETPAICTYLAEVFPKAGLGPTADERADFYRWMFFASGPLENAIVNQALGFEVPAERQATVGYGNLERAVAALEHAVSAHEYIAGKRFTAADVYVASQIGWGMGSGGLPRRPAFEAYAGRTLGRPASVRAQEIDDGWIRRYAAAVAKS